MLEEPTLDRGLVIRVCCGPTCGKRSDELIRAVESYIEHRGLAGVVALARQYCFGRCMLGPNVLLERWHDGGPDEDGIFAVAMGGEHPSARFENPSSAKQIPAIIDRHLAAWRDEDGGP